MVSNYKQASFEDIVSWINNGEFILKNSRIYKRKKVSNRNILVELQGRSSPRNRSDTSDIRFDIRSKGRRKTVFLHQFVWMFHTRYPIPDGFEVHHVDEDNTNNDFSNLVLLHPVDHTKIHNKYQLTTDSYSDIPF